MLDLFLVLLQVLFIGLKLAGKIQWSWWLVLLPMIIYIFLYIFLFFLVGGFLFGLGISLTAF
ncbi:hypothetical protein [Helicobacter turcicus]|uniref:Uncharacterized protein n=1 Tax=Helicobacter turcicus TaxID=2867412 RepID=A0ABS7JMX2_9HELI|nr:hypothetical protein [Helicobacter turcicus]MBX7490730.1 hypothetical protein [Helicobacter turcicus]MBX7545661.1 hypothetical protein [Helicobacter turcicus]